MWDSATGDLPYVKTSKGANEMKAAFKSERGKIERLFGIFKNRFGKFHKGSQKKQLGLCIRVAYVFIFLEGKCNTIISEMQGMKPNKDLVTTR